MAVRNYLKYQFNHQKLIKVSELQSYFRDNKLCLVRYQEYLLGKAFNEVPDRVIPKNDDRPKSNTRWKNAIHTVIRQQQK